MKNLQTGVDKRLLWKMTNRHSYYNKEILWSRQLFQRTDNVRESVDLRNIDPQMTLNLIVIFNSFTDISFLQYVSILELVSSLTEVFWGASDLLDA